MNFCKICGSSLNENGVCPKCGGSAAKETVAAGAAPQQQAAQQPNFNQQQPQGNPQPNFNQQQPQQGNQQPNFNQQQPNMGGAPNGNGFMDKVKKFLFGTKDFTAKMHPQDIAETKTMGLLNYLGILFLIPFLSKKQSKYMRFHANQGLILLITDFGLSIVNAIITALLTAIFTTRVQGVYYTYTTLSGTGSALITIFTILIEAIAIGYTILGIYNVVKGYARELPIIGRFRIIKEDAIPVQPQNFNGQPQNFNGQPQNFNGQPQNFNGQPQNFNGQPQNFNGQPQNFNGQPQNFNGQPQNFGGKPQTPQAPQNPQNPQNNQNNNQK